jgi:uncharacterized protein (DUF1800 family)
MSTDYARFFPARSALLALACSALVANANSATPSSVNLPTPLSPEQRALHALNRLGYGPRPGDIEHVLAIGVDRYIAEQLNPQSIADPPALRAALAVLPTASIGYAQLFREYEQPLIRERRKNAGALAINEVAEGKDAPLRKELREKQREVVSDAASARLLPALDSPRQLEQVMTEFWFNHFNIFVNKGLDRVWIAPYEREAIRPHVLGKFRDLLGATAKSPAMLFYLDNWRSSAAQTARVGRDGGLNENYARELMELHTLGIDGGYTQTDVTELARVFTGWTFDRRGLALGGNQVFQFDARRHDRGDKTVLGKHFHSAGQNEGERALDMLAAAPATARHISYQLAQYFVADEPSKALVDRLAARYRATDGDIRAVLAALFASSEFWDPANVGTKFKTPYQFVLSALRASDVHPQDFRPVLNQLRILGMPLFGCITPDGYKNTQAAWLTPNAMVDRVSFATALGSGRLPVTRRDTDAAVVASMAAPAEPPARDVAVTPPATERLLATLAPGVGARTREALDAAPTALRSALVLGAPEFMRH